MFPPLKTTKHLPWKLHCMTFFWFKNKWSLLKGSIRSFSGLGRCSHGVFLVVVAMTPWWGPLQRSPIFPVKMGGGGVFFGGWLLGKTLWCEIVCRLNHINDYHHLLTIIDPSFIIIIIIIVVVVIIIIIIIIMFHLTTINFKSLMFNI